VDNDSEAESKKVGSDIGSVRKVINIDVAVLKIRSVS
jgi:hypothetical protein